MSSATDQELASPPIRNLSRADFAYTSCYCEENVYLLCQRLRDLGRTAGCVVEDLYAVFISNQNRSIPLWRQRAGQGREGALVVWDYHVICIQMSPTAALVWDMDTLLEFPMALRDYTQQTFWNGQDGPLPLADSYQRRFRVVHAPHFLAHFASDRSHMVKPDGSWASPPPSYPCISAQEGKVTNNLQEYLSMEEDEGVTSNHGVLAAAKDEKLGLVLDEEDLIHAFSPATFLSYS